MTWSPQRRLLLALPLLAVLVVLWGVLTNGLSRSVLSVQVLGGPSLGGARCAWRIVTTRIQEGRRVPRAGVALRVTARSGADERSWTGTSDESGLAEALVEFTAPLAAEPWLRVEELPSGSVLAEGPLAGDAKRWRAAVRRRGGWLPGRADGRVALRVAVQDGVLAVPFEGRLQVEASFAAAASEGRARPAAGVELAIELEGAERTLAERVLTDGDGITDFEVRALEHDVRMRVTTRAAGGETSAFGAWEGALPVLPGALVAELGHGALRVRSPVVRDRAYVSFVTGQRRLGGGSVRLSPDSSGGSSGDLPLDPVLRELLLAEPSYAVVSSEYDERSPSAVGWPLAPEPREARQTFDVPEQVLLDGTERALAALEHDRQRRRAWAGASLAVIGSALLTLFWSEARPRKRPRSSPGMESAAGGAELLVQPQRWALALALLCIALGLFALGYFGANAR